jgi:hypothetical protein
MRPSSKTHETDDERSSSRHGILHCKPRYPNARMDQTISREEMHLKTVWKRQRQGFADELRFDDLLRRPDEPDDNEHQAATLAPSEDWQGSTA